MRSQWFQAVIGMLLLGACTREVPASPAPVGLSLRLRTKASCGAFSSFGYDTGCLSAIYVAVRDASNRIVSEECRTLDDRPSDLGELLLGPPAIGFSGVSANRSVVFEVRGLHDVALPADAGPASLCARPAITDHWLFWGQSDPVDLAAVAADAGTDVVEVLVECRDCAYDCEAGDCVGCSGIGVGTCTATFPTSFCVPANVGQSCEKPCQTDRDCFDGALACDGTTGRCNPASAPDGTTGGPCTRCRIGASGSAEGCDEGLGCVGPPGATEGFCAEPCPDVVCASGTKCNRIGNDLILVGS
jgi:hypothetical protein